MSLVDCPMCSSRTHDVICVLCRCRRQIPTALAVEYSLTGIAKHNDDGSLFQRLKTLRKQHGLKS